MTTKSRERKWESGRSRCFQDAGFVWYFDLTQSEWADFWDAPCTKAFDL
jgi:hypothetical protein